MTLRLLPSHPLFPALWQIVCDLAAVKNPQCHYNMAGAGDTFDVWVERRQVVGELERAFEDVRHEVEVGRLVSVD